ncbi:MAG: DUF975 family protein [Oscillospiraceae bacterium]|nr:DUF975 family protein [Oscillospiraceae bacterium]
MGYDRGQLKRDVKQSMKRSGCMMVTLLFTIAVSAGTWLINTLLGGALTGGAGHIDQIVLYHMQLGRSVEEAVYIALLELFRRGPGALVSIILGGLALSIVVALWQSVMDVGYEGWCLGMVRREDPPVSKIFGALPQIGPVLLTRVLTGVFELLLVLPLLFGYGAVLFVAVFLNVPVLSQLLMLAGSAGFVLGALRVTMRYALVDYVLLDKGLSGMDAIRESKRLMQGNTGRGFVLQLSFAGWYALMIAMVYAGVMLVLIPAAGAFFSGGSGGWAAAVAPALFIAIVMAIGVEVMSLWLKPYVTGSMAKFYDWANGSAGSIQGGPSFDGGWGDPGGYTWNSGSSGPGTGAGSGGGFPPPPAPPKPPRSPRDDPWD